jgi:hypothetical protein
MNSTSGSLQPPIQRLPLSQKTEEWRKRNVDYFISKYDLQYADGKSRKSRMKIAYDLYNSVFDENDFKYVTDPFDVKDGFPANIQNFNIIKPKIDLLVGEETKKPYSYKVIQVNEDAVSRVQERYKQLLTSAILDIAKKGNPEDPVTEEEIQQIESIGKYMNYDYRDIAEKTAYHSLQYLNEKLDLKNKFVHGFKDGLIGNLEVHYVGVLNGEPVAERVNPIELSYDDTPGVQFIEDGDWATRRMKMSVSSIYDRLYDLMNDKDLTELLDKFQYSNHATSSRGDFNRIVWKSFPQNTEDNEFDSEAIDVWHVTWKSLTKVGFLTYFDEEGEEQTETVDETYEPSPEEDIEWEWVTEVWEGYRIGDDIYTGIQPIVNQQISIDNPNSKKLPYIGAVYNNDNTKSKSLVEIMKPLQYMYLVLWYRLEVALARDKGKIINMDITQIPKSMGVSTEKWMHYLSSMGVNFFNPYEEGWDVPGREGGKPAGFNQFSSQDLSMAAVISEHVQLMMKIEEMVGELSGISRQRQGAVNTSELVGNVERSVIQSSHITEIHFWVHNRIKKRVLEALLEAAKSAWSESGKKKLHYITDDMIRVFLDISEDFLYSDYGIFASDSTQEAQNLEQVRSLLQPAMQNGASLSDIAEVISSNNLTEIRKKLEVIEKNRQQREEQMQQMANQSQMQVEQMKQQAEAEKLRIQEEDSVRKSDTDIRVALIKAGLEEDKLQLEADRISADIDKNVAENNYKYTELTEEVRSNKADEEIERKKVSAQVNKSNTTNK